MIKHKHFDRLQKENLRIRLYNLHAVLKRKDIKSFRISKQGDLNETLPKGQFMEILKEIFKNSNINITVCQQQYKFFPMFIVHNRERCI